MSIKILDASDERAWTDFSTLPREVYQGDTCYLPPERNSERREIEASNSAEQRVLLAYEDGRPVARVVARLAPELTDKGGRPHGLLGFFEALERPVAVAMLLAEAVAWLGQRGAGEIVGPMNGDTWHHYRFNVGPWSERPFLLEPYNPSYYPALWEANGFEPLAEYHSKRLDDLDGAMAHLKPCYREAIARGFRFEPLRRQRFNTELKRLYRLSCLVFRGNLLYREISEPEFLELYSGFRSLADPRLVFFAVAPNGHDAGFLFAYPDLFDAVAALRRGRWGLAFARLVRARWGRVETVNLKSLGVAPEHRRNHLASALMFLGYRSAQQRGATRANLCLFLGSNPSGRLDGGLGRLLRRYRLYRHTPASE
jgi:GNAT superfamily N-acetyltransferase